VQSNHRKEGTTVNGVEGVGDVQSKVNPITMLVENSTDRVSDELNTWTASYTNLSRPRGAIRLGGRGGTGWRWLQEGGKTSTVVVGCNHGDCTAPCRANGNGAKAPSSSSSLSIITVLSESNEATTKEPGPNLLRKSTGEEELDHPPESMPATAWYKRLTRSTRLIRQRGGEVAVSPGKVLITPSSMISSRAMGEATEENLVKGLGRELRVWINGGKVLQGCRHVSWRVGRQSMVIRRVKSTKSLEGGGRGAGELKGLGSGSGTWELALTDEGNDVPGKACIIKVLN
jgi:hypothetical protein